MDFLLCATRGLRWLRVCCCTSASVEGWLSVAWHHIVDGPALTPQSRIILQQKCAFESAGLRNVCTAGSEAHPNILRMAPMILCTTKRGKQLCWFVPLLALESACFFTSFGGNHRILRELGMGNDWKSTEQTLFDTCWRIQMRGEPNQMEDAETHFFHRHQRVVCKVFVDASKINQKYKRITNPFSYVRSGWFCQ